MTSLEDRILRSNVTREIVGIRTDPDKDFYFFPYIIASGATDVDNGLKLNALLRTRIFSGVNSVIIKPIGWETSLKAVTKDATTKEYRNIKDGESEPDVSIVSQKTYTTGLYTHGFITDPVVFSSSYIRNNEDMMEQKVVTTFTVHFKDTPNGMLNLVWDFNTQTIKKDYQSLLWTCPELNSSDVLYIEKVKVVTKPGTGEYLFHTVVFKSLADTLRETGRTLTQAVQFAAPGEDFIFPQVIRIESEAARNKDKQNTIQLDSYGNFIFEDVYKKKIPTTQEELLSMIQKVNGVTSIQIEHDGAVGLMGIDVLGRKKNEDPTIVERIKELWFNKCLKPVYDPLMKAYFYEDTHVILPDNTFEMTSYTLNWKADMGLAWDPNITRENRGSIHLAKQGAEVQQPELPDYQKEYKNIVLHGAWRLGTLPEYSFNTINSTPDGDILDAIGNPAPNPKTDETLESIVQRVKREDIENATNVNSILNLENVEFVDVLNHIKYINRNVTSLSPNITRLENTKNRWMAMIKNGGTGLLTLAGAGIGYYVGGRIGLGAVVGNMTGRAISTIFEYLPSTWFENKKFSDTSPDKYPIIMSKKLFNMLETNLPIEGTKKLRYGIPTFIFTTDRNPASSIVDSSQLRDKFHLRLTDKIQLEKNSEIKDVTDLKTEKLLGQRRTYAANTNSEFIIDAINIKEIGMRNISITFYDNVGNIVSYYKTKNQSLYSDNMLELDTFISFNTYNGDHFDTREYIGYDLAEKELVKDDKNMSKKEMLAEWDKIHNKYNEKYEELNKLMDDNYNVSGRLENIEKQINELITPNDISEELKNKLLEEIKIKYLLRQQFNFDTLNKDIDVHFNNYSYLKLKLTNMETYSTTPNEPYKSWVSEKQRNELEDKLNFYITVYGLESENSEKTIELISNFNNNIENATVDNIGTIITEINALTSDKITEKTKNILISSAESVRRTIYYDKLSNDIIIFNAKLATKEEEVNNLWLVYDAKYRDLKTLTSTTESSVKTKAELDAALVEYNKGIKALNLTLLLTPYDGTQTTNEEEGFLPITNNPTLKQEVTNIYNNIQNAFKKTYITENQKNSLLEDFYKLDKETRINNLVSNIGGVKGDTHTANLNMFDTIVANIAAEKKAEADRRRDAIKYFNKNLTTNMYYAKIDDRIFRRLDGGYNEYNDWYRYNFYNSGNRYYPLDGHADHFIPRDGNDYSTPTSSYYTRTLNFLEDSVKRKSVEEITIKLTDDYPSDWKELDLYFNLDFKFRRKKGFWSYNYNTYNKDYKYTLNLSEFPFRVKTFNLEYTGPTYVKSEFIYVKWAWEIWYNKAIKTLTIKWAKNYNNYIKVINNDDVNYYEAFKLQVTRIQLRR